jgi:hypothetical protein
MTALGLFLLIYVIIVCLFALIWFWTIKKSNLARDFAEYKIAQKLTRNPPDFGAKADSLDESLVKQLPRLLEEEKTISTVVPALGADRVLGAEYVMDLTSVYIARGRVKLLKRIVEKNLEDRRAQDIIGNIDEKNFRVLMANRLEQDALHWLTKKRLLARVFFGILQNPMLSLIMDRYVGNYGEIRDRRHSGG